jgi:hypothetical protein
MNSFEYNRKVINYELEGDRGTARPKTRWKAEYS